MSNRENAVLILFFNNPERLERVFNQVAKAKPKNLFLYQDGPRPNKNDFEGINKCREIVANIDWPCEVHRWYQEKNMGCDPSEYLSQKWAFSFVEKCIILEDDDVPSDSFFEFCWELLDKYENDERVSMIAGMNHEEITDNTPYDYFFTSNVSIWGWATWRRVVNAWDEKYSYLNDAYIKRMLIQKLRATGYRKDFFKLLETHSRSGIAYYETIHMSYMLLNSGLSIVPTKNMILNIGYTGGTHSNLAAGRMPKNLERLYSLKTYNIEGPIKHPPVIIEDYSYRDRVSKMMGWNKSVVYKFFNKVYIRLLRIGR